jgi:hypothetical protein
MITIRNASIEDALKLAETMRSEDVAEVYASSGLDPLSALLIGIDNSTEAKVAIGDDEPIAIFGVCPDGNESIGRVWLLGSDAIHDHRFDFLRKSKEWVDVLNIQYPVIYNHIDSRNTVHIRWLQWLGFSFINETPDYGFEKRPFYQFVRINPNV